MNEPLPGLERPLPLCEVQVTGGRVTARPTEGRWAGNLEVSTRHVGDAVYLLKLLLRELDRRGEAWNNRRPVDDAVAGEGREDVSPTRKVP